MVSELYSTDVDIVSRSFVVRAMSMIREAASSQNLDAISHQMTCPISPSAIRYYDDPFGLLRAWNANAMPDGANRSG